MEQRIPRVPPPSFEPPVRPIRSFPDDVPFPFGNDPARYDSRLSVDDENERWGGSETSSLRQLANSLAQRVGISPQLKALPTDAELEAEGEREREKSRREAERILTQEADERRKVEERIRGLLDSSRSGTSPLSRTSNLPPPSSPRAPPSSTSPKEQGGSGWWAAAKARLTPTKEKDNLTEAQQIAQDARNREKKEKKLNIKNKLPDPSYLNLNALGPYEVSPATSPVRSQPTTPTRNAPALPAPPRNNDHLFTPNASPHMSAASGQVEGMYVRSLPDGSLDISETLVVIAKRFEKLEKWTVGHVRALEDRMSDVERWLVEKEEEKEREKASNRRGWRDDTGSLSGSIHSRSESASVAEAAAKEVGVMRDELDELRSRVGILGREVAKLASSPRAAPQQSRPAETYSSYNSLITPLATPDPDEIRGSSVAEPTPKAREPSITSPGSESEFPKRVTSPSQFSDGSPTAISTMTARTKFPYPSGDYTSPLPSSPTSPPLSRQGSISGLPRTMSPIPTSGTSPLANGLPTPSPVHGSGRFQSASPTPTPRKRYTVALGRPISSSKGSEPSAAQEDWDQQVEKAFSINSPNLALGLASDDNGETVGKSKGASLIRSSSPSPPVKERPRPRPMSTYGVASSPMTVPITPLRTKGRSKSTDRIGLGIQTSFVDPYVERQKEREKSVVPKTPVVGRNKLPVDQLVKFFDNAK